MGLGSSKECGSGTLRGAYAPPLPGIPLPQPLDTEEKKYLITCPNDKKGGDTMVVNLKGRQQTVVIPKYVRDNNRAEGTQRPQRPTRPGDKFYWTHSEWKKVIASTLPTLPGATIAEAKPMIWASASEAYFTTNYNDQKEQITMGKMVGPMLQVAQEQLLRQAVKVGCNAVLGVNINISTDSTGENGNSKLVIATMSGTPCIIIPNKQQIPSVDIGSSVTMATAYNCEPGMYPVAQQVFIDDV